MAAAGAGDSEPPDYAGLPREELVLLLRMKDAQLVAKDAELAVKDARLASLRAQLATQLAGVESDESDSDAQLAAEQADSDSEDSDSDDDTPLDMLNIAIGAGDVDKVRQLIDDGEDASHALTCTAWHGNTAMARMLLERGATIQHVALRAAARCGRVDVMRLFLEHGADVDSVSSNGETLLMSAAKGGRVEMLEILLERSSRDVHEVVNQVALGRAALMLAARFGHDGAARFLLEHGADPDMINGRGESALQMASRYEDNSFSRVLLSYGASRDGVDAGFLRRLGAVPLVRDCRAAVEEAVRGAGDRDVARLCGDYVSMVGRRQARRPRPRDDDPTNGSAAPPAKRARRSS